MTVDAIRSELQKSPFKPFAIVMADGREVRVRHHDYLLFSPGGLTLMVFSTPEAYTVVDTLHVTQLIPDTAPQASAAG